MENPGLKVIHLSQNLHLLVGGETGQGRRSAGYQHRLVGA